MNIREANCKDSEAISALASSLSKQYVTPEFPEGVAISLLCSMTPDGIEDNIRNGYRYHVAEINGKIVGVKDNNHLHHLFVCEEHHRKGIARQLWNVAKEACITGGNNEGFTVNSSKYAQIVYDKLGFAAQSGPQERNGVVTIPMKLTISS